MAIGKPDYAPVINQFQPVRVSVDSEASANAASVGPFRGFFVNVSTSFTVASPNGKKMAVDNIAKNTTFWVQGYLTAINASAATATTTTTNILATDIIFGVV